MKLLVDDINVYTVDLDKQSTGWYRWYRIVCCFVIYEVNIIILTQTQPYIDEPGNPLVDIDG